MWSQKVVNAIVKAQQWTRDHRTEAAALLSRAGPNKYTPHNLQALTKVLAGTYQAVVSDIQMGGMDGFELCERIQALDAIREVGPGGHFLGCAHTQANFETAFYRSPLADNNSVEQWEAEGARDMAQRANARWKSMLAEVGSH